MSQQEYCYLTTIDRKTGQPHEIEIWFSAHSNSIYLLSGGGLDSDWVKNLLTDPKVQVRIGDQRFSGIAQLVKKPDEQKLARELLAAKYYHWKEREPLNEWARIATPVTIKLTPK